MIRTLMAEADPVARLGIRWVLGMHTDALEIDEACSQAELLSRLRERYYELIMVEPAMCAGSAAALVGRLRELSPWSDILVFTALDELTFGVEAIRNGAKGYLMKTASRDELLAAVRRVARGKLYFSQALAAEFATGMRKHDARSKAHDTFSMREFQVFSLAVCGATVLESAHILQLSAEAVNALKNGVMLRLQVATPHEMVEYARSQGLLQACRATCGALWSGRFCQAAATPNATTRAASSSAGIGFEMR